MWSPLCTSMGEQVTSWLCWLNSYLPYQLFSGAVYFDWQPGSHGTEYTDIAILVLIEVPAY